MHGLTMFKASEIIEQARQGVELIDTSEGADVPALLEATHEALRLALANQVRIAETLEKIKMEFDKFEDGLGKIL